MNEKFFSLPEEKQQAILNAGYRVFSQNTYKNSPMSQIAEAAGISKSLLFHYFHNKKELYLYLWQKCADTTEEYLNHYHCYEQTDFFQTLFLGIKAKAAITRKCHYMATFALRSFYEKDENIAPALLEHYKEYLDLNTSPVFQNLNPEQFLPELDIQMMVQEMYLASEGYLWEMFQKEKVDAAQMEEDFTKLIRFWKSLYQRS